MAVLLGARRAAAGLLIGFVLLTASSLFASKAEAQQECEGLTYNELIAVDCELSDDFSPAPSDDGVEPTTGAEVETPASEDDDRALSIVAGVVGFTAVAGAVGVAARRRRNAAP